MARKNKTQERVHVETQKSLERFDHWKDIRRNENFPTDICINFYVKTENSRFTPGILSLSP